MGNAILYTMFYMVMKLVNRERILARTWMYCILAHVAWFLALRLFLDSKTKWSVSISNDIFYLYGAVCATGRHVVTGAHRHHKCAIHLETLGSGSILQPYRATAPRHKQAGWCYSKLTRGGRELVMIVARDVRTSPGASAPSVCDKGGRRAARPPLSSALRALLQETPAQSRQHNAPCSSLSFYDTHDLWHGVSAAALFLSFNMLLTMDDALRDTPRDQIPTF